MVRYFWVLLGLLLVLGGCTTQRMVCPAYQSAFIYDQHELKKKFSYFVDDSTPKVLTASKNKYLIAEPASYRKKLRNLQTVEMRQVFVHVPDSISGDTLSGEYGDVSLAELDLAARSVMDTTMASGYQAPAPVDSTKNAEDSVYVITKDKELRLLKYDPDSIKYRVVDVRLNVDQDNYMWYLRDYLILPDVRLAKMQQHGGEGKSGQHAKSKKGIKGFFKNLFKRKKKQESDSTDNDALVPKDEFDFVDTTAVDGAAGPKVQGAKETKKKKGGFFSFLKKKDQPAGGADAQPADKPKKEKKKKEKKKKDAQQEDDPAEEKKEEEKDDGF